MTTLRIVYWNVKAPSLSRTGPHTWTKRRTPLKVSIAGSNPDVAALAETGSGLYLTWWKRAMKNSAGLRWAKGGRYWQNMFNGRRARCITGGVKHQPKEDRLNNDDKPMTWELFEFNGARWIIGNVHPENEGGNTTAAVRRRAHQVLNSINWLFDLAKHYDVPHHRVILCGDFNDPTGEVIKRVHAETTMRDAFTRAKTTSGKGHVSNSKWQAKPFNGRRIDFILVHKSVTVSQAINSWANGRSDHNKQTVDILI